MVNEKKKISPDILYIEACNTFRHYSTASMTIRIISIAQALVIVSGVGILLKGSNSEEALFASVFGFLFTIVLFRLHAAYFKNAMTIANHISKIEKNYGHNEFGGIRSFMAERNLRLNSFWKEKSVIHGPHIFFSFAFIFLISYTTYLVICK